jgi:hypothetical protein
MTGRMTGASRAPALAAPFCVLLALSGAACSGCRRDRPATNRVEEKVAMAEDEKEAERPVHCPEGLLAARRGGAEPDRYVAPSVAERTAMTGLVTDLLRPAADLDVLESRARAIGYRFEPVPEMPGCVLLRELDDQRRGGGAYLFRVRTPSRLVVQAPHTFFDEGTLPLACDLFQRTAAAALFIETAHRYKAAEVDEHGDHPADVAHSEESFFQAATAGILSAPSPPVLVQLHGFGPRESDAAVIVSTGALQRGDPWLARTRELLTPLVPGRVDRFPDETEELGATTNVQGRLARSVGARFLHVEMSAALRRSLLPDADGRSRFLDALGRTLETR